jgi:hypothetical protein
MGSFLSIFSRTKTRGALEQELEELAKKIGVLEQQESSLQTTRRRWIYFLIVLSLGALLLSVGYFYVSALYSTSTFAEKLRAFLPILIVIAA